MRKLVFKAIRIAGDGIGGFNMFYFDANTE